MLNATDDQRVHVSGIGRRRRGQPGKDAGLRHRHAHRPCARLGRAHRAAGVVRDLHRALDHLAFRRDERGADALGQRRVVDRVRKPVGLGREGRDLEQSLW